MTHLHDSDHNDLRAMLRAVDDAPPLSAAREEALHARILAQGAPWLALHATAASSRRSDADLEALRARIRAAATITLASYRRPARRRNPIVELAVRWSRPALPLALAAGIGATMVLLRTPRESDPVVTVAESVADVNTAYDAVGGSTRTFAVSTPEAAIGGTAEATP